MLLTARLGKTRRKVEAARLASMLAVELQSLLAHYADNLALLDDQGAALLSLRSPGAVFRGNTSRLAGLLSERILAPLVAVYAHHERIEALHQLGARPNVGKRVLPDLDRSYFERMRERILVGTRLADAAILAITANWPTVPQDTAADPLMRDEPLTLERVA